MNPIINDIFWENNSRVKNSSLINPTKVISESSTDKFPAGKITIRLHNTSKQNLGGTAYFYGKMKNHTSSWGGSSYDYPDGKLMVTFFKEKDQYVFNGGLSESYSLQDIADAVSYCKEILNKI